MLTICENESGCAQSSNPCENSEIKLRSVKQSYLPARYVVTSTAEGWG